MSNAPTRDIRNVSAAVLAHLRALPPRAYATLALLAIVNVLVAASFLWSQGGQETRVRMEVAGGEVRVWLDGKQTIDHRFEALPDRGGITVRLEPTTLIPSLPSPRGLDSLTVTDLQTGEVLHEDEFESLEPTSIPVAGAFVEKGHIGSTGHTAIGPFGNDWGDIRVDAKFDNITGGALILRSIGPRDGVAYTFRPYRHLDSTVQVIEDGRVIESVAGPRAEVARSEVMRSLVAMSVRGYPMLLLAALMLSIVVLALSLSPLPTAFSHAAQKLGERWPAILRTARLAPWAAACAVAIAAVVITGFINAEFNGGMPHVPDEVSYIFQARLLASGRVSASPPPVIESFSYFHPALISLQQGNWASVYPFGHPILLAVGVRLGILWLIPPLVGGATLMLVFVAGQRIYNSRVGLAAMVLLAASPFFLMTASNFMSHNTAAFYTVASLCCVAYRDRHKTLMPLLGGIFFGLILNTRPLTAVALVAPFGLMLLSWFLPRDGRVLAAKSVAAFVVGGFALVVAYGLYNLGTTGSLFLSGYSTNRDVNEVIGFGGSHSVSAGIQNEQTQLASLLLVFNGWPQAIGIILVVAAFLFGTRNRWDWTLLLGAVAAMAVYTFYEAPGLMHGPRYWYEAMPFLVLLAARGAEVLAVSAGALAAKIRERLFHDERRNDWASALVVYGVIVVLSILPAYDWLHGDGLDFGIDHVPNSAASLRGFNGVNDTMARAIEDADLRNALVLVDPCTGWQCYGSVFWKNDPSLDGEVVYARNLAGKNGQLFEAYPDRLVYQVTYPAGDLVPYGQAQSDGKPVPEATPPRAGDVPTPTPEPTPTPDPLVSIRNDQIRRGHFELVRQALVQYRDKYGQYPLAEGVQTLCTYSFDSGCKLNEFIDVPSDPAPGRMYWYQSDGNMFVLYASMEAEEDTSQCPEPVPQHVADVPKLYCVRSEPTPAT